MRETKYRVNGIPLVEYCKNNNIEISKVYWQLAQGKSLEDAIAFTTTGTTSKQDEISLCKYCHSKMTLISAGDDLFYARCSGCTKWSPYEFLGATRNLAIKQWNIGNRPIATGKKNDFDYDD